jgi:hypothetical protein
MRRVIVLVLVSDRPARLSLRLTRRGKTFALSRFALANRRNSLRLRIPRAARPGVYMLSLRIVAGATVRMLTGS